MRVRGNCLRGCGDTLIVSEGLVRCSAPDCPDSLALDRILQRPHLDSHQVLFANEEALVIHPLWEHENELAKMVCPFVEYLQRFVDMPMPTGHYIARPSTEPGEWDFAKLM